MERSIAWDGNDKHGRYQSRNSGSGSSSNSRGDAPMAAAREELYGQCVNGSWSNRNKSKRYRDEPSSVEKMKKHFI
ncbi:MAG: hypothetical protein LE168_05045 [Endomicrobium sp.]|nr:hypothetical protein [Endomicrobium sp.]